MLVSVQKKQILFQTCKMKKHMRNLGHVTKKYPTSVVIIKLHYLIEEIFENCLTRVQEVSKKCRMSKTFNVFDTCMHS